jgi:flagellar protein FlgJ
MPAPLAAIGVSLAANVAKGLLGKVANALDPKAKAEEKARKTSQDFEKMFLEQSLDRLVSSNGKEGPLGDNGTGGDIYRSMLVKEYAGNIVKNGGIGIGDQVYGEMLRMQETGHAKT